MKWTASIVSLKKQRYRAWRPVTTAEIKRAQSFSFLITEQRPVLDRPGFCSEVDLSQLCSLSHLAAPAPGVFNPLSVEH